MSPFLAVWERKPEGIQTDFCTGVLKACYKGCLCSVPDASDKLHLALSILQDRASEGLHQLCKTPKGVCALCKAPKSHGRYSPKGDVSALDPSDRTSQSVSQPGFVYSMSHRASLQNLITNSPLQEARLCPAQAAAGAER